MAEDPKHQSTRRAKAATPAKGNDALKVPKKEEKRIIGAVELTFYRTREVRVNPVNFALRQMLPGAL